MCSRGRYEGPDCVGVAPVEEEEPVVQYSTVQYSTVQYSTVQYSTKNLCLRDTIPPASTRGDTRQITGGREVKYLHHFCEFFVNI